MSKRARILIVDDNLSMREMLEIFLKKEGFNVASASSAEEGLTQVKSTDFDLIINATAASINGDVPAIPGTLVSARTTCYDLAYSKEKTPFVRWAASLGCARALQGWGMLVEQAAESFSVWRGIRPQTAPVLQALIAS